MKYGVGKEGKREKNIEKEHLEHANQKRCMPIVHSFWSL